MTPESLMTPAGISKGRAPVNQYRALLVERKLLLKTNLDESERMIQTRSPTDTFRKDAMVAMNRTKEPTVKIYDELDRVQAAHMESISVLLDWFSSQVGKLSMNNSQLMFTNENQRTDLAKIAARLQETEDQVNAAVVRAQAFQQEAAQRYTKNKAEVQKLLK